MINHMGMCLLYTSCNYLPGHSYAFCVWGAPTELESLPLGVIELNLEPRHSLPLGVIELNLEPRSYQSGLCMRCRRLECKPVHVEVSLSGVHSLCAHS